ncbi:hypothetical protein AJ79_07113 [Helicocarpus griseus UAMH5409]|uniref:Uncharacterized protein n=1 Tax=Helicocarpus griseus UAMH5409 TaxID=1447875 RepID=A0A2B7X6D9_9EURO|nr:hypothetical protein AJ79_07113 [Helicocarpus griseus UAMH5409]
MAQLFRKNIPATSEANERQHMSRSDEEIIEEIDRRLLYRYGWPKTMPILPVQTSSVPSQLDPITPQVRTKIQDILDAQRRQGMGLSPTFPISPDKSINVLHRGPGPNKEKYPVTLVMTTHDAISEHWWANVIPALREACDLRLPVEILQAESLFAMNDNKAPGRRLTMQDFGSNVSLGASCCIQGASNSTPLGGLFKVQFPGKTSATLAGLTNHHVIRTAALDKEVGLTSPLPPDHRIANECRIVINSPSDADTASCIELIVEQTNTG